MNGRFFVLAIASTLLASLGCQTVARQHSGHAWTPPLAPAVHGPMPRELSKVVLPVYRVEPPDILVIDAVNAVPKPPYRLRTTDVISVQVDPTPPDVQLSAAYSVEPGGVINLGYPFGAVKVSGSTLPEAKLLLEKHLQKFLVTAPVVTVGLLQFSGKQQIQGEHLVGPDGMVTLGSYGSVSVIGRTLEETKAAIEQHLSMFLEEPEISVNVFAYNSKVYYVIREGAGLGDAVTRLPVTGNETVLDAIANIQGLDQVSSKNIWIARPYGDGKSVQVMPVDWRAITAQGVTATNYQIMPGDRVFIAENRLVAFDTSLGKFLAPLERIMGFSVLSAETATRLSGRVLRGGGNPRGLQ